MKNIKIDWTKSDQEIVVIINTIGNAYTLLDKERWYIGKARMLLPDETFVMVMRIFFPGEVINLDQEGIYVQTGNGIIKILELQSPTGIMSAAGRFHLVKQGIAFGTWFDRTGVIKTMK
ncbi:methionyl-tRNA formyltransferase [Spiroplasma endosymbiont of Stenodema calcarata]|uniref:methionyl-tRNA formyltransferase n=1 Tax=Spiroplasma endosymbiont of Stenodema calcarata TaxID=3139328 RepID=UPI003CCB2C07